MLSTSAFLFAVFGAFLGGLVDAIAGGGGLIVLPCLLLTNLSPHIILGTNKFSASLGTLFALLNYARSKLIHWPIVLKGIFFSLFGAYLGTRLALIISPELLGRILVFMLPLAFLGTFLSPRQSTPTESKLSIALLCFLIGLYDGFFGPATGTFLILGLSSFLGLSFLHASATAKAFNLASNFAGTVTFVFFGSIYWSLAISMAVASILGNLIGSRFAIQKGSQIVRRFLCLSLSLLMITLIVKYFF